MCKLNVLLVLPCGQSSGKLVLFDNIEQVMETFSMLYNVHYRFESNTLLIE